MERHEATCGHTTEVSDKVAHTFGNWTTTKEATEEAEGSKERVCTVCEYKVTESIEKLDHTHKFATDWSKDETYHWYAAICEHTTEVSDKAEHTFGIWKVETAPTSTTEGTSKRICSICNFEETKQIIAMVMKRGTGSVCVLIGIKGVSQAREYKPLVWITDRSLINLLKQKHPCFVSAWVLWVFMDGL